MFRSAWLRRRAIVLMVCALLLKAAVPMFASAAAAARGVSVAEVCTVYGVATDSAATHHAHHRHHPGAGGEDHSKHAASHRGDHCALAGLAALAAADEPACLGLPPVHRSPAPPVAGAGSAARDSCALWVARLKQGPPAGA